MIPSLLKFGLVCRASAISSKNFPCTLNQLFIISEYFSDVTSVLSVISLNIKIFFIFLKYSYIIYSNIKNLL